jgi:hypothetical protein
VNAWGAIGYGYKSLLIFIRGFGKLGAVSWKSRVIGFGHAELDIGDADTTEIAQLYREHIPVL